MFYKNQQNLDVTVFCCNHCVQRCVKFGLRKDFLSMIKRLIMRRISATVSFFHEAICLIIGSDNNCKVKCLAYLTSKSLNHFWPIFSFYTKRFLAFLGGTKQEYMMEDICSTGKILFWQWRYFSASSSKTVNILLKSVVLMLCFSHLRFSSRFQRNICSSSCEIFTSITLPTHGICSGMNLHITIFPQFYWQRRPAKSRNYDYSDDEPYYNFSESSFWWTEFTDQH